MKRWIVFLVMFFILSACQEAEIEATGDLVVNVNLGVTGETQYALFTEAAYLDGSYLPLREGVIASNTTISFQNLLPGTYVVEFYFANAVKFTGQVIPGESTAIEAKL